jgi:hypothetical protein
MIFDLCWKGVSQHILDTTIARDDVISTVDDVNLYLAALLVMGLTPQPQLSDYFMEDTQGIFGSQWMQQHCTRDKLSEVNARLHFDPGWMSDHLKSNMQALWAPHQAIVVDEMIIPFTGRWKYIQHIKGKPHNTGTSTVRQP